MSNTEESGAAVDIAHFREQVRHALEHLYDADVLADHWLTHQLRFAHLPTGSRKMRQTLIDGIQSMRPTQGEPPGSQRWLMHQVLLQRYVQQIGAGTLADQQGMSSRTLRRLQRRALAQLAEILLQQIQPQEDVALAVAPTSPAPNSTSATSPANPPAHDTIHEAGPTNSPPVQWIQTVDDEIGWMRNASLSEPVDAAAQLAEALQTIAPLARSTNALIENKIPAGLPEVSIHPSGLRQVFLSVLSHAIKAAANGVVTISAVSDTTQLTVTVRANPVEKRLPLNLPESLLILAWRILAVFGGQIEQTQSPDGVLCVQITLMVAGGTTIMVIDDNADVLQLYERYVLGTRYTLTLCQKPEEALPMAASLHPAMIVMDIMMPNLDGWSLLGQLHHHPLTAAIPVIVSTIVSERELALTLGAVDFVQKPVTRGEFLDALTRWVGREVPRPR